MTKVVLPDTFFGGVSAFNVSVDVVCQTFTKESKLLHLFYVSFPGNGVIEDIGDVNKDDGDAVFINFE